MINCKCSEFLKNPSPPSHPYPTEEYKVLGEEPSRGGAEQGLMGAWIGISCTSKTL